MAEDDLVGNIATENLLQWAQTNNIQLNINQDVLQDALRQAAQIFN